MVDMRRLRQRSKKWCRCRRCFFPLLNFFNQCQIVSFEAANPKLSCYFFSILAPTSNTVLLSSIEVCSFKRKKQQKKKSTNKERRRRHWQRWWWRCHLWCVLSNASCDRSTRVFSSLSKKLIYLHVLIATTIPSGSVLSVFRPFRLLLVIIIINFCF